jgi:DNA-binding response OmpR family regulator
VVTRPSFDFNRQRVVVANDESAAAPFIIDTLRHDGHRVTRAGDASPEIFDLALRDCHLLICGTGVAGVRAIRLFNDLREPLTVEVLRAAVRQLLPGCPPAQRWHGARSPVPG